MMRTIGLLLCGVMVCFGAACTQKAALDNKKGNAMKNNMSEPANKEQQSPERREIIKAYRQSVPALRFIGKKYSNADSDPVNGFSAKWNEWFENGWFSIIEKQIDGKTKDTYEDGDAYIGLIGGSGTAEKPLEYWIGIFMPENTTVPEGFGYIDFPKGALGICWVYGKGRALYGNYGQCVEKLSDEGFGELLPWCFERYADSRFTTPDEKGNVILDIGFFIK